MSQNWKQIYQKQRASKLSVSRSKFEPTGKRAISLPKLSDLRNLRLETSAGYRYILVSDVLQFFPTTYTHSIPWALHTKAVAKKNNKHGPEALAGNNIDYWIRQGQSGQTIGIPIGPDTSHIVAETIGSEIDLHIRAALRRWPAGYRNVDDFFLCFQTFEEAEQALAAIVSALSEFELHINPDKTKILSIADYVDEDWVHRLDQKEITNIHDSSDAQSIREQKRQITELFEYVIELARQYDDESIIKYALKKTTSSIVREENWKLYEAYIARLATVYPNNLETAALILITYHGMGYDVDRSVVERIVTTTICQHAPLNHHSEVAWALWLALEFQLQLPISAVRELGKTRSSICTLLAFDLEDRGLLRRKLNKEYWRKQMTLDGLLGPHWLATYQAARFGWLKHPPGLLSSEPFFAELDSKGIDFYDTSAHTDPLIRRRRLTAVEDLFGEDFDFSDSEFAYEISDEMADYID
ncbi:RNA-directed DNA polymerase [Kordiimonas sp.]|uniref:RNA-directed DNA polymerase n=1 Tax=Kordiimonas sp. TaxID=1970157 RepID=UPI003B518BC3